MIFAHEKGNAPRQPIGNLTTAHLGLAVIGGQPLDLQAKFLSTLG
jgi:hypothetical protein